jgi:hypothetical protein
VLFAVAPFLAVAVALRSDIAAMQAQHRYSDGWVMLT